MGIGSGSAPGLIGRGLGSPGKEGLGTGSSVLGSGSPGRCLFGFGSVNGLRTDCAFTCISFLFWCNYSPLSWFIFATNSTYGKFLFSAKNQALLLKKVEVSWILINIKWIWNDELKNGELFSLYLLEGKIVNN